MSFLILHFANTAVPQFDVRVLLYALFLALVVLPPAMLPRRCW